MEQNTPGPASAMLPFFSAALEQIGNGVILFDEQNRIMYVNAAMEAICGWPRAQLLGRNLGVLA
ncbi:PAS domain-containing protein, partial [Stenotrophomonas pictorum]